MEALPQALCYVPCYNIYHTAIKSLEGFEKIDSVSFPGSVGGGASAEFCMKDCRVVIGFP